MTDKGSQPNLRDVLAECVALLDDVADETDSPADASVADSIAFTLSLALEALDKR